MNSAPFFDDLDRAAERAVLVQHDFAALHGRVRAALRVRAMLIAASLGALLALLAAVGGFVAGAQRADEPTAAPNGAAAITSPVSCVPVPCGAPVMEPPAVTPVEVAPDEAPARPPVPARARAGIAPDTVPAPSVVEAEHESSPLRVQLALYQEAQRLAATDPEAALVAARRLRGEHAMGPLVVEAGLLEARVLVHTGRCEQARPLLSALEGDARMAGKGARWRDLAAACARVDAHDAEAESTRRPISP